MKDNIQWIMMVLMSAGLLLSACGQGPATSAKVDPATVEEIEGSELKRVILTEKAAERLDLQTAIVREEQVVKVQTVVGEVVVEEGGAIANPSQLWVRTPFNETDFKLVARDQPARILPLERRVEEDSDKEENGWTVEPDETFGLDDDEDSDINDGDDIPETGLDTVIYYVADSAKAGLAPGQRVFIEVPLAESEAQRKVIPYASLIYEIDGGTWVYVKEPTTLTFVRQSVTVDYIKGDLAFLTEGPPVGAEVVTVGGQELYGAETGVSK